MRKIKAWMWSNFFSTVRKKSKYRKKLIGLSRIFQSDLFYIDAPLERKLHSSGRKPVYLDRQLNRFAWKRGNLLKCIDAINSSHCMFSTVRSKEKLIAAARDIECELCMQFNEFQCSVILFPCSVCLSILWWIEL